MAELKFPPLVVHAALLVRLFHVTCDSTQFAVTRRAFTWSLVEPSLLFKYKNNVADCMDVGIVETLNCNSVRKGFFVSESVRNV